MKKTFLAIVLSISACGISNAQWVDLVSLGNSGFSIDSGSTAGSYTQTPTTLTFDTPVLGDSIYGFLVSTPTNWSLYSAETFGIKVNSGTLPQVGFTFEIYDNTYEGGASGKAVYSTSDASSAVNGYISLTSVSSTLNFSNVVGVGFGWNGDSSNNLTALQVAAIPEPSTYTLIAIGGLALFFIARRRKAQA